MHHSSPAELYSDGELLQIVRQWSTLAELAGCWPQAGLGCGARPCSARPHACSGTARAQGARYSGQCYALLHVSPYHVMGATTSG